jgi:DNA-binding CsgD family transcriptional regulator
MNFLTSNSPGFGEGLMQQVLDENDTGLLVCSQHAQITWANAAARHELQLGRWLRREGQAVAAAAEHGELLRALSAACLRGRRQLLELRSGDERLYLSVGPIGGTAGSASTPAFGRADASQALLMLGRRGPAAHLTMDLLGLHHGLTPAERRVLGGVAAQRSPQQIADDSGTAVSTVRTQLLSLRAKLGVDSKEALLALLGGLPAMAMVLRSAVVVPQPPVRLTPLHVATARTNETAQACTA